MPPSNDPTAGSPLTPVTRQELFDLAWQEPMLRVAERFGVSSSYLARVFTELRVPRPAPGYWAQREFGKSPPRPELPPARPGDLTEWCPGSFVGTAVRAVARTAHTTAADAAGKTHMEMESAPRASKEKSKGTRTAAVSKRHELLAGVKPLFLKTRKTENGILRPFKRMLVDVMASEAKLDDALDAAQALFEALIQRGFHVGFAPAGAQMPRAEVKLLDQPAKSTYQGSAWAPERATVVHVRETVVGLTLFEMTEEVETVYVDGKYVPVRDLSEQQLRRYTGSRHWRSKEVRASGRFCLQAYCPSWLVKWSKRWQEAGPGAFLGMIPGIVQDLEAAAPGLSRQLVEAQLHAEAEHRRWQEEVRQRKAEAERQRREVARQEATRDLLRAISSWDEARRVQAYFESVESELLQLPEEDAAPLRDRLRLAKELVGTPDPLAQLKSWKAPTERLAGAARSP